MSNKERFLKYLQTCVKSTRATDSNPLLLGGNAPKDYTRFLESDRLFDYNPSKWAHLGSMYDINDASKALEIFNTLIADEDFIRRDKDDNQGWRKGAISHYVCFLNAQEFFTGNDGEQSASASVPITLPLQQIYYGAPGTGKSHGINEQTKGQSVIRTTFHPDSDYSTFVGAYKPTTMEVPVTTVIGTKAVVVEDVDGKPMTESKIVYEFVEQAFLKAYIKAWKNLIFYNGQPQYLIIEEINRGNCAQIFGDLFQLLDRNSSGFSVYPIHADSDMRKHLRKAFARTDEPEKQIFMQDSDKQRINQLYDGKEVISEVLSGEVLLLPNNLYIWATMNTSDQSLFPIDSAFKRRWDWKYVPICKKDANYQIEVQKEVDVDGEMVKKTFHYDWWNFLDRVNTAIAKATSSEDKKLGYFFCKASKKIAETDMEPSIITADKFVGKVVFYLWNDVFKDFEISDAKFRYGEDDLSLLSTKVGEEEVKREFSSFFDEKGNAKHEAVANLLDDLKIEGKEVEDGGSETKSEAAAGTFLKVIFPDGHEICEPKIVETFVNSIIYIARTTGYEAIAELGIIHDGLPILSKIIQNTHAVRSIGDNKEWRLLTGIRHDRKAEILQEISDKLDLDLEIVVSGKDSPAKETPERISDTNMPYRVTFSDGTVICIGKGWDTYVATLRKIGLDKALPYGEIFSRKNKTLPLITTKRIPDDGIYKYYDVDGYYVLSGTDSQHRLLKRMNKDLNLGLTIE